jgi:hypothetical protein
MGVIEDSQPAEIHKNTTKSGSSYFLTEKLPKTAFFSIKNLTRHNYNTFCEEYL